MRRSSTSLQLALLFSIGIQNTALAHSDHHPGNHEQTADLVQADTTTLDSLQKLEFCQTLSREEFESTLKSANNAYLMLIGDPDTLRTPLQRFRAKIGGTFSKSGRAVKMVCLTPIQAAKFAKDKIGELTQFAGDSYALLGKTFVLIAANEALIEPGMAATGALIGGTTGGALIALATTHGWDSIYYPTVFGVPKITSLIKRWFRAGGPTGLYQLLLEQHEALGLVNRFTVAAFPLSTTGGEKTQAVVTQPKWVSKLPRAFQIAFAPEWLSAKEASGAISVKELFQILEANSRDTTLLKEARGYNSGQAMQALDRIEGNTATREQLERISNELAPTSKTSFAGSDLFRRARISDLLKASDSTALLHLLQTQTSEDEAAALLERVDITARRLLIHFDLRLRKIESRLKVGKKPARDKLKQIRKLRQMLTSEARYTLPWTATKRFTSDGWRTKLGVVWTNLWRQTQAINTLLTQVETAWSEVECEHMIDARL